MTAQKVNIQSEETIYFALSVARSFMKQQSFTELDQQKVLVSVSELTRNILDHGHGQGFILIEIIPGGIRFAVCDEGPGITNLEEVLQGGKSPTSRGLGLGLAGVKRLMDTFEIVTSERGTKVVASKWAGK